MKLEPWPHANVEPKGGEHEIYSIAVSLKRIADATPSLRDRFAGQALAGFATFEADQSRPASEHANRCAKAAYFLADAMLQQRERGQ